MEYWEIVLIERGYLRRNVLQYQLQRLQAYGAMFAMNGDKQQRGPSGWIPMYFDRYKQGDRPEVSQETIDDLLGEMAAINAEIEKKSE